ncbi:protein-glutamate O-methyltransferase CheR [Barrientosiimonas marina]|uniref:protein-glutamate O-methyltransferase n=1 Tax=Lentibacillus kimchii TaxID=1542911 RepID=A0ABW2UWF2_9BACI
MTDDYLDFAAEMKAKHGIDLTLYKETQMKRRLTSLRDKNGFQTFHHYLSAIDQNQSLLDELLDRITINVSNFYRNSKRWDVLRSSILPQLLKSRQKLTIWSAACSTGEEPYSVAIMLDHNFPQADYQILATDIDDGVLEKAAQGIYPEQSLRELPWYLRQKYFIQKENEFHLDHAIKRRVQFKKHDLLADAYPANVDLIICRNVLIYFTEAAKSTIYKNVASSLTQHGVLFVGSTEQIFKPENYRLDSKDTFFYQKNE